MTELLADSPVAVSLPGLPPDRIRDSIMESRQRWRHLVNLASDLSFETDAEGRFVFLMPESPLGWVAESLIGQPSELLVGEDGTGASFNPFRPVTEVRRHRAWLRCADGGLAMMSISAAPLYNAAGEVTGARGIGVDITANDEQTTQTAGRLRRSQVLHHILLRVGRELDSDSMMDAAFGALINALGADGVAVIGSATKDEPIEALHEYGSTVTDVLGTAAGLLVGQAGAPRIARNPDGCFVLVAGCEVRSLAHAGLVIWRGPNGRPWDQDDRALAAAAACLVRMILEYESVQREMAHQARTDPLTGLLNRRAFIDEMRRQVARLDRGAEGGTMLFIDLDCFKAVNDRLGHAIGDQILIHFADMLRKLVRPSDLVTRMGGDEFAVWLSGADHMTAAERADALCKTAPVELQALLPEPFPDLGVSIGIATRRSGSEESIEDLTRRADMAMYAVKRSGRRHWRVSLLDGDS